MSDKRSRKWLITQNNPEEHMMNHAVIRLMLMDLKPVYWCMCDETGEEGTYHTHLFMQFRNAVSFSRIKGCFPSAHIDKAYGTPQENRDYVRKEGKHLNSEKKTTNHMDTFEEDGEMQEEKQGKRTDLEDIYKMIEDGCSELEIIQKHPSFMNSQGAYQKVRSLLHEEQANQWRPVEVVYIYGDTSTGKTRYVIEECGGYDGVYRVSDYQHPFDGYDGQDAILFDEFRGDLPLSAMLNYLDGHPVDLPCRYHNKKALWSRVYIVSNIPLYKQWQDEIIDMETRRAFERRIGKVLHFVKGKDPQEERVMFIAQ